MVANSPRQGVGLGFYSQGFELSFTNTAFTTCTESIGSILGELIQPSTRPTKFNYTSFQKLEIEQEKI